MGSVGIMFGLCFKSARILQGCWKDSAEILQRVREAFAKILLIGWHLDTETWSISWRGQKIGGVAINLHLRP